MILNTSDIKQITSKILSALDNSEHCMLTDTLEIVSKEKVLYFNITNSDYYVSISIPISIDEEFHATVNASMFLKLVSQITTDTVELIVSDKNLEVIGNGSFKLPLMFAFDALLELPELSIDVVTQSFDIEKDILNSIALFNTKEVSGNAYKDIIRKSYYLDDKGCITFGDEACVNNFTLEKPIKVLLGIKVVKLFKLFNDDKVNFCLGFNQVGSNMQTRISLSDSSVKVTAITYSTDGLIAEFPVNDIRSMVTKVQDYNTSLNRAELAQSINRFMIFSNYDINNTECTFTFINDELIIENKTGDRECIKLSNSINDTYKATLDLNSLKSVVETSKEQLINLSFGDHRSFIVTRGSVFNILPECE